MDDPLVNELEHILSKRNKHRDCSQSRNSFVKYLLNNVEINDVAV